MSFPVRVGAADDRDPALAVWQRSTLARSGRPVDRPVVEKWRRRLLEPDVWFLVALDPDVVGVTSGMPAREDDGRGPVVPGLCHLSMVFVDVGRWGEGIGAALVAAALEQTRDQGYQRIQLWTHEDNERAQRLYRRHGFVPSGRQMLDDGGEAIGHWSRDL